MSDPVQIGERIRKARQDRGWTQEQLAEAVGVSRSAVAQWETGRAGQLTGNLSRIAEVLSAMSADASGVSNDVMMFLGGPVSPETAFVLHTTDYRKNSTIDIDSHIALTDAAEVLRDIGLGKGPQKSLLAFGYAGWAPSQLDDEIKAGAWTTVPENLALVFDDDRSKVWTDAVALQKTAK